MEESRLTTLPAAVDSAPHDDDLSDAPPPPPRERKRPLRTYGKRSAQSREADTQPPKKQKINEETRPEVAEPQPQPTPPPPTVSQKEPPKRGSIMSYFKPAPPSSRASSQPPPPPPPPAERVLTPPPSSPPIAFGKARKRRLTTRPRIDEDNTCTRPGGSEEQDGQDDGDTSRDIDQIEEEQSSMFPSKSELGVEQKSVLAEGSTDVSNRPPRPAGEGVGKKGKLGKRPTKERVQMTLSLSINPDPGFTVCKDCEVLYNPLNEKDRKEHKKQHAAHVRAKLKGQAMRAGQGD